MARKPLHDNLAHCDTAYLASYTIDGKAKGAENGLGLGWNSDEYGFFSGAYGYFNVFLLLLFFGGLILDKFGIRFTGILSTVLMFGGALLKWYALGHEFDGTVAVPFFGTYSTQVVIAALGFAINIMQR